MAREVRVAILGDSRDFSRAVSSASGDAKRLDRAFSGIGSSAARMGKAVAIGLGGVAVGTGVLAKGFYDAAIESQKVSKQTEAVLKSMGDGANVTAKQIGELSDSLAMQTGIDDELIQSGQNVLLTFGKLRNGVGKTDKVFDRATKAALDMSVALKMDMTSASMMVGKALNDPIRGLTALRRSGIQFTEAQEKQIKAMVAANNVMGAQKIMLDELERQFGGSAEAQGTAAEKLGVIWGNLQEKLGEKLIPVVSAVATWLGTNLPKAIEFLEPKIAAVVAAVSGFVETAAPAVREFVEGQLEKLRGWWEEHGPKIVANVKVVAGDIKKAFETVVRFIADHVLPTLGKIVTWIVTNEPAMRGLAALVGVTLTGAFIAWAASATAAAAATILATLPIWLCVAAVAALTAASHWAINNVDWLSGGLTRLAQAFFDVLGWVLRVSAWVWNFVAGVWAAVSAVLALVGALARLPDPGSVGNAVKGGIKGAIPGLSFVPGFAQGGTVPGALGQPQLILAHGGERVVTHGQQMRGGGGDTIVIPVSIGGQLIDTIVVDAQARTARRGVG